MNKLALFLDIETIPGDLSLIPEEIPVKVGAITDQQKLKAKVAAERNKWVEKAALSWVTGRIICVSIRGDGITENFVDYNEHRLLMSVKSWFEELDYNTQFKIVTFNGLDFDIPYLVGRFAINEIRWPWPLTSLQFAKPWDTRMHIDLFYWLTRGGKMKLWIGGTTMDSFVNYFGIDIPDKSGIAGNWIPTAWKTVMEGQMDMGLFLNTVMLHCSSDVERLEALYQKTQNYFVPAERYIAEYNT